MNLSEAVGKFRGSKGVTGAKLATSYKKQASKIEKAISMLKKELAVGEGMSSTTQYEDWARRAVLAAGRCAKDIRSRADSLEKYGF